MLTESAIAQAKDIRVVFQPSILDGKYGANLDFTLDGLQRVYQALSPAEQWSLLREMLRNRNASKTFTYLRLNRAKFRLSIILSEYAPISIPEESPPTAEMQLDRFRQEAYATLERSPDIAPKKLIDIVFDNPAANGDAARRLIDLGFQYFAFTDEVPAHIEDLISKTGGFDPTLPASLPVLLSREDYKDFLLSSMDLIQTQITPPFADLKFDPSIWSGKTGKRTVQVLRRMRHLYALRGSLLYLDDLTVPATFHDDLWQMILKDLGLVGATISKATLPGIFEKVEAVLKAEIKSFYRHDAFEGIDPALIEKIEQKVGPRFKNVYGLTTQMLTSPERQSLIGDLAQIFSTFEDGTYRAQKFRSPEARTQIGFLTSSSLAAWEKSRVSLSTDGDSFKVFVNLQGMGLLGIGELAGPPTCLNAQRGCSASSAIAYFEDANTQAVAGFMARMSSLSKLQKELLQAWLDNPASTEISFNETEWLEFISKPG